MTINLQIQNSTFDGYMPNKVNLCELLVVKANFCKILSIYKAYVLCTEVQDKYTKKKCFMVKLFHKIKYNFTVPYVAVFPEIYIKKIYTIFQENLFTVKN